jgi:hypothetical protein
VKTGLLNSLEECELMIDGIGPDKISDLTTNVIRQQLVQYTGEQCQLHGILTIPVPLGPCFDRDTLRWESKYQDLPVAMDHPLLLVSKAIARWHFSYDHEQYYRHFALTYLQAEHLSAGTSLVHTLKNGRRVVHKKELEGLFPRSKEALFQFSRKHPETLRDYREHLEAWERKGLHEPIQDSDERVVAAALRASLKTIPAGPKHAANYHSLMVGVVEFLFFPQLLRPRKEREFNEGRKRIDILMENGARAGIFHRLHDIRKVPWTYVPIECKNYSQDLANPELDQMIGRFSTNRGRVGIICCRRFRDRSLFVKRCQDTLEAGHGLILPLDDKKIDRLLKVLETKPRRDLDIHLSKLVDEISIR